MNGDGINEIVAGTKDGRIEIIDGTTRKLISAQKVAEQPIYGLKVLDLFGDNKLEYVFSSGGEIYFLKDSIHYIHTRQFGSTAGMYNSLQYISDVNNDRKKEIFFGTNSSIYELTSDCYKCLQLSDEAEINDKSCRQQDDGSILMKVSNGKLPYTYKWNTGATDSLISNLAAGTYTVTITDNNKCILVETENIKQSQLITSLNVTKTGCDSSILGSAKVNIIKGQEPFNYKWSNGNLIQMINRLHTGKYSVTITDSNNCISNSNFSVVKDTLSVGFLKHNLNCYGYSDGMIELQAVTGTPPYTYKWSNSADTCDIYNLSAGLYSFTVTDSLSCIVKDTIHITQPAEIKLQITTTPDTSKTAFGDGTATVNISGGIPPYYIQWDYPFSQTTLTAINLIAGTYHIKVYDSNYCSKSDSAIVGSSNGINEITAGLKLLVCPTITNGIVYLQSEGNKNLQVNINIYNPLGSCIYSEIFNLNSKNIKQIDLSSYLQGIYILNISTETANTNYRIVLIK